MPQHHPTPDATRQLGAGIQPHTRALVAYALRDLDLAAEMLEDSVNVALADLPTADEYRLLGQIAGALIPIRAALRDYRAAAAELWPESRPNH